MTARFSIFESMRKATVELPDDIRLRIYDIILDYGFYGTEPEFEPEEYMLKGIFESLRYAIDQSIALSESGRKGGQATKKETTPETTLATTLKSTIATNRIEEKENRKEEEEKRREEKEKKGKGAPAQKHKHGSYGWVLLTDAEYNRIVTAHGKDIADYYISMIDEKAQQTGNKNKWKDWNLTVQKAIREKWGKPPPTKNAPHGVDPITGIPYAN